LVPCSSCYQHASLLLIVLQDGSDVSSPSSFWVVVYVDADNAGLQEVFFTRSTNGCASQVVDWSSNPLASRFSYRDCYANLLRIGCTNAVGNCSISYKIGPERECPLPDTASTSTAESTGATATNGAASTAPSVDATPSNFSASSQTAGLITSNLDTACECVDCENGVWVQQGFSQKHSIMSGSAKMRFTAMAEVDVPRGAMCH
jgi:hypothetical protein